jgi:pyruvate dehydrogenase E2 component (dihydrolipoamide acetyltransferase)
MTEFKLPELGENITTADVVRVLVREGDVIAANDGVLEVETEKAVVEVPCPLAGKVAKVHVAKGQTIQVGQVLLTLAADAPAKAPAAAPSPSQASVSPQAAQPKEGTVESSPSLLPAGPESRRLARKLGVDLAQVRGSGKRGRITPEDVRAAAEANLAAQAAATAPIAGTREPVVPPGELAEDGYGPIRRERMSRIRRTIAAQMVKSVSTIPHVTTFDDADVTDLERLRKSVPQAYLGPAVKLTAMAFVMKAVARRSASTRSSTRCSTRKRKRSFTSST